MPAPTISPGSLPRRSRPACPRDRRHDRHPVQRLHRHRHARPSPQGRPANCASTTGSWPSPSPTANSPPTTPSTPAPPHPGQPRSEGQRHQTARFAAAANWRPRAVLTARPRRPPRLSQTPPALPSWPPKCRPPSAIWKAGSSSSHWPATVGWPHARAAPAQRPGISRPVRGRPRAPQRMTQHLRKQSRNLAARTWLSHRAAARHAIPCSSPPEVVTPVAPRCCA
jgi:hypothetical protein